MGTERAVKGTEGDSCWMENVAEVMNEEDAKVEAD